METNSTKLFKGLTTILFSASIFYLIAIMIVITPVPPHQINYDFVIFILGALVILFGYGCRKLDQVEKFLLNQEKDIKMKKKVRTFLLEKEKDNEMFNEPEN